MKAELAAIRDLLAKLNVRERGKLDRALEDVSEEAAKPKPDKEEVAGSLGRVVKYANAADDFGEHAAKIAAAPRRPRLLARNARARSSRNASAWRFERLGPLAPHLPSGERPGPLERIAGWRDRAEHGPRVLA